MQSRYLVPAAAMLVCMACGGDSPTTKETAPALVIGDDGNAVQATSIYQMPTPNELFMIVRQLDGTGDKRALSAAPNADRFATLSGRALNFGVYATDMVYASNFNIKSEVVRYYLACKKLGEQLGLTDAFNVEVQRRLEKNLSQGDSLDVLTNDAYFKAYQQLQDERMGPVLALVLAGGWVESMHLICNKVTDYDAKSPLVVRIGEQKTSLEQLLDMMEGMKEDPQVAPTRERLIAVRDLYDRLEVTRTPHGDSPSSSGRMVLGDDVTVAMTSEQFTGIRDAVEGLRETITRSEGTAMNQ